MSFMAVQSEKDLRPPIETSQGASEIASSNAQKSRQNRHGPACNHFSTSLLRVKRKFLTPRQFMRSQRSPPEASRVRTPRLAQGPNLFALRESQISHGGRAVAR